MSNALASLVEHLRRATAGPEKDGDGPLLERFVHDGDEAAFVSLVNRHGPMVLALCQRVLRNAHDAEDAFQATFLVLARKAAQVRRQQSLGSWLYSVAYRIAVQARVRARRTGNGPEGTSMTTSMNRPRGDTERPDGEPASAAVGPADRAATDELRAIIDEEINRLPEKYRAPVVACYLEGKSNEEAAQLLHWPVGSVKGRLSRARDLLSQRLTRRGLALTAPVLGVALAESSVSANLLNTTVRAAATYAAGQAVTSTGVSVGAAELTQGAFRAMTMHKLKLAAALAVVLALGAGVGVAFLPKTTEAVQAADEPPAVFTLPAETPQVKADRDAVVKGNTAFAIDLYKRVAQDKDQQGKNLFLSPYSISTALAMTSAGARADTVDEMAKVLHFPVPEERLHPAFAGLIGRLQANKEDKGFQLATANALWGQKNYPWLNSFLRTTQTNYGAGLRQVDFKNDKEAARQTINHWVEEQTKDKIKELLHENDVTELTRLVLTNAIYFKGDWKEAFDKKLTRPSTFYADAGQTKTDFMHQTGDYGYLQADGIQALELPYKGNQLSMIVVLPNKPDGLADLEKELTPEKLTAWMGKLAPQKVEVALPKFKTTARFQLKEALVALGMKAAFGDNADFSGMDGERDLYITKVIHQAFVDVNEEGTEAAAATAVVVGKFGAAPRQPAVFRADHPFLYLIRDKESGSILFLGRLTEPAK